jgi:hypothetical protein
MMVAVQLYFSKEWATNYEVPHYVIFSDLQFLPLLRPNIVLSILYALNLRWHIELFVHIERDVKLYELWTNLSSS